MPIEFNKVIQQVTSLGEMLQAMDFDLTDRMERALQRYNAASDLDDVREHIGWIRHSDISGYRGAAPTDLADAEPVNGRYPAPQSPQYATIIAGDGSQVYPDEQNRVHYYLLNIGLFIFHHGRDITPEQLTIPDLRYHPHHVHDRYDRLIRNRTVDDRRTVFEMQKLAEEAWRRRDETDHLITLYDNRLLFLPGEVARSGENPLGDYLAAMLHMHDSGATLAGYIDNPHGSRRFMQLLYLLSLDSLDAVRENQNEMAKAGDLEGLHDREFFYRVLEDGERSAIMVQNSPQNYTFKSRGPSYEIAFFYLKVFNRYQSKVVRVDLPMWVARDKARVDALHAIILEQCKMQGRNPYPYALTRADELAFVGIKDKEKLEQLVNTEFRKAQGGLGLTGKTAKQQGKDLARGEKRYFIP